MNRDEKYPQHAKLRAVLSESQSIGRFLDWMLNEREWVICYYSSTTGEYEPIDGGGRIEALLAEYFEIDRVALSMEKDAMVDEFRREAAHEDRRQG